MNDFKFSISIIIPTLNRIEKLKKLVDSITNVDWTDAELIIVDDSAVNSKDVISVYGNQNIIYIHRGQKLGVSSARNEGAEIAKGKYLIFLDDDDAVSESWFTDFRNTVDMDYDLVFCNMRRITKDNPEGLVIKPSNRGKGANGNGIVIPGSFMIKKEVFDSIGKYDERLLYAENTELFYRITKFNPTKYFIDKENFYYYPSEDGGSKNLSNMIDSNKLILEKHDDILSTNTKYLFNQIIGVNYMRFKQGDKASKYFLKAIQYKPFRFDTYMRLVISKSAFLMSIFYK